MQKLVGKDDQELNQAIQALAPHANGGVFTVGGLSLELRKLGGDIVSASLQGEDVSWKEKAKARFNNVVKVEKDGELITGTKTQERIEAAQFYLDKGDVESAYIILNELQGPARTPQAEDFIQALYKTSLANQVEGMLTGKVMQYVMGFDLSKLQNGIPTDMLKGLDPSALKNMGNLGNLDAQSIKGLVESFENMIPKSKLIEDPTSGYKFLDQGMGAGLPKMRAMPDIEMP